MYAVYVPRAAENAAVALWFMGSEWHLSIARVTRVAQDLFIEIRLNGPEDCTATVHVRGRFVLGVTARLNERASGYLHAGMNVMGSSRFRQTRPSIEAATLATTRLLSATLKCLDAAKAMAADVSKRFPADSRRIYIAGISTMP